MKEMWINYLRKESEKKKSAFPYPIDEEGRVWKKSHKGRPGMEFIRWCKATLESEGRVLAVVSGLNNDTSLLVAASIALALAPVSFKYITELYNTNVS